MTPRGGYRESLVRIDENHRYSSWLREPGIHQGPLHYPDILKEKKKKHGFLCVPGIEMSRVVRDIDLHKDSIHTTWAHDDRKFPLSSLSDLD